MLEYIKEAISFLLKLLIIDILKSRESVVYPTLRRYKAKKIENSRESTATLMGHNIYTLIERADLNNNNNNLLLNVRFGSLLGPRGLLLIYI